MKPLRWLAALASVILLLAAGVLIAAAAAPDDAPYIDMQTHELAARSETWYRFDFNHERPGFLCRFFDCPDKASYHGQAHIRLPGLAKSGLNFAVYAPLQMRTWQREDPVGWGSPDGDDLVWVGGADDNGTWYVRVVNNTGNLLTYRFTIDGIGVAISRSDDSATRPTPAGPAAQLEAARAPTPTPTPVTGNTEPGKAGAIDGYPHTLASGGELWFTVGFARDRVTVRLLNGASRGLNFAVYTPGQLATWWKEDPLGRGTPEGADLVWTGDPDGVDMRYIRVFNQTGQTVDFTLIAQTPLKQPPPLPRFLP